jgi:hypothetical protein
VARISGSGIGTALFLVGSDFKGFHSFCCLEFEFIVPVFNRYFNRIIFRLRFFSWLSDVGEGIFLRFSGLLNMSLIFGLN